jgi:hypothetical protein
MEAWKHERFNCFAELVPKNEAAKMSGTETKKKKGNQGAGQGKQRCKKIQK